MDKEKFISLLSELNIPISEGIQNDTNSNQYPRVTFWEYVWESIIASGEKYNTKVTYQVSFFSNNPRELKLLELIEKLNFERINPIVYHEYIQSDRCFHSYFSIEILENL